MTTGIGHRHSEGLNTNTHILSTLHNCLPLGSLLSYKTSKVVPLSRFVASTFAVSLRKPPLLLKLKFSVPLFIHQSNNTHQE